MPLRQYIEQLFLRTLERIDIARCIAATVHTAGGVLRIGDLQYRLHEYDSVLIVSLGKAAIPMVDGLVSKVLPQLLSHQILEGIVVSGAMPEKAIPHMRYYAGGHPAPNEASREAAEDILASLHRCTERSLVFFLVSGGASAMVEKPVQDSISVEDTARFYRALVHSGLPVTQINFLRKHFSAVKGGRMAEAASGATLCTLIVSDVPEGSLNMVGSGPSMPDTSTLEECRGILEAGQLMDLLPASVGNLLVGQDLPETVKPHARAFSKATHLCLLSNADMLREANSLAAADGFHVVVDNSCDDWGYERAGEYLLGRMRTLTAEHGRVCLLSGGEVSVRLVEGAGRGGRNQQFALWCAIRLQETRERVTVLSAGTDGIDGNSPAAGALVDSTTCDEARQTGLDAEAFLTSFDTFTFFSKAGGALMTGPTGNNVRDLRILLAEGGST